MIIKNEYKKNKRQIEIGVGCSLIERIKYLFTNKISFRLDVKDIPEDEPVWISKTVMTYGE